MTVAEYSYLPVCLLLAEMFYHIYEIGQLQAVNLHGRESLGIAGERTS